MFDSLTFGRRLAVGFGLAGLVLLIIAFVSFRTTSGLVENNGLVSHSHQVEVKLGDLLTELVDAETGQRGFIITGDENYLAPYQAALGALPTTRESVRQLTADNPDQQRRLDALSPPSALTWRIGGEHTK